MVRKIQGKRKSASVNHLKKNNTHVISKKDIANTLADNFSAKFRKIKDQQEKQKLIFTSDNTESYNTKFSLTELTDALSKAHDSDYEPAINKYLLNKWQLVWNTAVDNKLHSIKSILGEWRPAFRVSSHIHIY